MNPAKQKGVAAASSAGIVIATVKTVHQSHLPIPQRRISQDQCKQEAIRLEQAISTVQAELKLERAHLERCDHHEPMTLLDMYSMLISDPELLQQSRQRIHQHGINAEWALRQQIDLLQSAFAHTDDDYLRNRKEEIELAGRRIIHQLLNENSQSQHHWQQTKPQQPIIYIGNDFSISDIVSMWRHGVAGMITEQGGVDTHNIIVARGVNLPALVGATGILETVKHGDQLILDGEQGCWIVNPDPQDLEKYQHFIHTIQVAKEDLKSFASQPSHSLDGHEMKLMANIEFIEELDIAEQMGIDGIGLYRSEFLFINEKTMPEMHQQFQQYARLVERMQGKPITIRLLDVGGDRPWLYQEILGSSYSGANPAMGLRGIRLLLRNPAPLKKQLKAICKASDIGTIHILIPMVSCCDEVEQVRNIVTTCCKELGIHKQPMIGAMIEIPAAALIADELADVCDFFSIGTNDLMQYTLASDRQDDEVAALHYTGHHAMLKLITMTATAAKKAAIPVSVCGELAANPAWTNTFLNLDMAHLSMSAQNILTIRKTLRKMRYQPIL